MPLEIFASGRDDPCWSPQAEDAPIRKHSTPSRLLCETAHAAPSSRSTVGRLQGYPNPRPNPVRARPCSLFMARDGARPAQAPPGPVSLLATPSQPKRGPRPALPPPNEGLTTQTVREAHGSQHPPLELCLDCGRCRSKLPGILQLAASFTCAASRDRSEPLSAR
jgi:hypothetical protein